jgi:hypothetical protein
VNYAKARGLEEEPSKVVKLMPADERIAHYVKLGVRPHGVLTPLDPQIGQLPKAPGILTS